MIRTYTAKSKFIEGLEMDVSARHHMVKVDEPVEQGGTDKGMNPVELLLSSISACLTMTILINAEAANLKVDDISVEVEGELDTMGSKGSARVRPGLKVVRTTVKVKTNALPETFQQFLNRIVLRCPVEDSVKNEVIFEEPILVIQ